MAEAFAGGTAQTTPAQEIADGAYGVAHAFRGTTSGSRGYAAFAAGHAANTVVHWTEHESENVTSAGQEVVAAAYGAYRIILAYNRACLVLEPDRAFDILLAVKSDYVKLRELGLGEFGQLGEVVECSEDGPLGLLWPDPTVPWDFED